jgi:ubiquinone/menaquinone biosynthesis C-methylase UbiE
MEKIATGNALLNPSKILTEGGVGFGNIVADLGTGGAGYFALQAAKMVGDRGRVYAIDVLKSALSNLTSRAKMMGITNIITVWANLEVYGGAKAITNDSIDIGILINVLHQSEKKREHILRESFRMIKHDGTLVVIDWKKISAPVGPALHLRVTHEHVQDEAKRSGFKLDHAFIPGEYHWGLVFKKP